MANSVNQIQMQPILFYDGNCGFCNRSIQLILAQERSAGIHFSAIQSAFAKEALKSERYHLDTLSTIYFLQGNLILKKSAAAFAILPYLKWYWQPLRIFQLLPTALTDRMYSFIAKRRKKLATDFCLLPTTDQAQRFFN